MSDQDTAQDEQESTEEQESTDSESTDTSSSGVPLDGYESTNNPREETQAIMEADSPDDVDDSLLKEIEEERERRLDPENRPDNVEVDNTKRTFKPEIAAFEDSDDEATNDELGEPVEDSDSDDSDSDSDDSDSDSDDSDSDDSDSDSDSDRLRLRLRRGRGVLGRQAPRLARPHPPRGTSKGPATTRSPGPAASCVPQL